MALIKDLAGCSREVPSCLCCSVMVVNSSGDRNAASPGDFVCEFLVNSAFIEMANKVALFLEQTSPSTGDPSPETKHVLVRSRPSSGERAPARSGVDQHVTGMLDAKKGRGVR